MKMKNLILLLFTALFIFENAKAQVVVTEDVHFDYYQTSLDNDFSNHFSNGTGLTQLQNNGIAGGCLQTPDSEIWGSNNALYCSRFRPDQGDTTLVSISFKYDSAGVHAGSFQRALSVWLIPSTDFNHYVVATVSWNKKIEMLTYSWSNNPYPNLALLNNHWYNYRLTAGFNGGPSHHVYLKAEVFELGATGTAIPSLVNSSSGIINDSVLIADTSISVMVSGTLFGGAIYLDDFHFAGREGYSDCINTPAGIHDEITQTSFHVYPSPATNVIYVERHTMNVENLNVKIRDITGRKLKDENTSEAIINLNVSSLSNGIYFLQCSSAGEWRTSRIIIQK